MTEVTPAGYHEVFDSTVDNDPHTYWTGGGNVSNCGVIKLISKQFCNLSLAVIRPENNWETIKRKVHVATILGTIQSSMTFFNYLSEAWKRNCEAERLLGVDIPGASDHPLLRYGAAGRGLRFQELQKEVIAANLKWAERLGI